MQRHRDIQRHRETERGSGHRGRKSQRQSCRAAEKQRGTGTERQSDKEIETTERPQRDHRSTESWRDRGTERQRTETETETEK